MFIPRGYPLDLFPLYEIGTLLASILITHVAFCISPHDYSKSTSEIQYRLDFVYKYLPFIELFVFWLGLRVSKKWTGGWNPEFGGSPPEHIGTQIVSMFFEHLMEYIILLFVTVYGFLAFGAGSVVTFLKKDFAEAIPEDASTFRPVFFSCCWALTILNGRTLISCVVISYELAKILFSHFLEDLQELWRIGNLWNLLSFCFQLGLLTYLSIHFLNGFYSVYFEIPLSMHRNSQVRNNDGLLSTL